MRQASGLLSTLLLAVACGGGAPPPVVEPPTVAEPGPVEPAPAPPPPPAAPAPTAEELKKAEEKKKLHQDFDKLEADRQAELARLTPELRKATAALVDKRYPSLKAAITAALAGGHRRPSHAERDAQRHPYETLEVFGIKPTHTVLEYGPGEGYWTELLAPTLAKSGKLYITMTDPNASKEERSTLYALRTKHFLDKLPEVYGKVEPVVFDSKAPKLGLDGKLDAVVVSRSLHGMYNNKVLGTWLGEFHRALKPNGALGIEQHRAAPGKSADETSKHGYLPEAFVIAQVEAAGFKLASKSEVNANPKDTKDYPEGVWSLPPTLREGEKDRAKYVAIGESDRMTLKFVKVASPK
ncbi:MAG TPA: methyltransferase domain-containing protein [Polyangiaceae bacterium]|nr:methyltransferase domain-containing protein [Polyangiaceae bacterium]